MILLELFSTSIALEVSREDEDEFETKFRVGDRKFFFNASFIKSERKGTYWGVAFGVSKENSTSYKLTKDGNSIKVMTAVKNSMQMFMDKYKPDDVRFTGDEGRQDLYAKMLEKYNTDYDVKMEHPYDDEVRFILTKK